MSGLIAFFAGMLGGSVAVIAWRLARRKHRKASRRNYAMERLEATYDEFDRWRAGK